MSKAFWSKAEVRKATARMQRSPERTYFAAVDDVVKVGFSKDPADRVMRLRYGSTINPEGYDISRARLIGTIPGGQSTESRVHMLLHDHLVCGEWFRLSTPVMEVIDYLLNGTPMTDTDLQSQLWAYLPEFDPSLARAG